MIIKDAEKEHLEEVLKLQKECFKETVVRYQDDNIAPLTETIDELESEFKNITLLIAVEGSDIVGSVRGYENSNTCYVGRVIVSPDYQNKGIGTKLINEIERKYESCKRFELFTGFKDDKNLYLYKKLGYKIFKEEKMSDDFSMIFLEKNNL